MSKSPTYWTSSPKLCWYSGVQISQLRVGFSADLGEITEGGVGQYMHLQGLRAGLSVGGSSRDRSGFLSLLVESN